MLYVFGMVAAFEGLYTPFFYVEEWATQRGFDKTASFQTFYLVSIMNGASAFGRVLPNLIADRYDSFPPVHYNMKFNLTNV